MNNLLLMRIWSWKNAMKRRKLLIAGNGGSAADSEHIAGELMKRFKTPRPVKKEFADKLIAIDPERGELNLQIIWNVH